MKRLTLFILAIVFALAATLAAQPQHKEKFLPIAVWYAGGKARPPMIEPITAASEKQWRADLANIKAMGFNAVRTWVEWSTAEPREGEYHFENLDLLLRLADEAELKVIVQVYADSAPEWVGQKYPHSEYEAQDGQPIPSQSAPGYCFDNRGVREAMLAFFKELARHAAPSHAFYAYDLWSEPAALNWARIGYKPDAMFCYCPASIERFRGWLKTKYKTLEALNAAWHRTFTDWSQVEPPRYGTILTYTDFVDWRVYYASKLAEDLKARNDAVKSIDAVHLTTSHAPNPSPLVRTMADAYDPTDDFLMKDSVDYFGTSFYPKLTSPDRNWTLERRALVMDLTRAITGGRGFYVGELQSGRGIRGTVVGSEITPQDIQLWMWGMLARGARAINLYAYYQMSAGYESGGYGLVSLDGTPGPTARKLSTILPAITSNADALLTARPQAAEVAIVFNPVTPLIGGFDETGSRTAMHYSVAGYHRMFFERNIPVDVVSSREITAASLAAYKLVIVPYPLMLSEAEAAALKEYVRNGGHMLTEARAGWVNEEGKASARVPGMGWDELLGVRENRVEPGKDVSIQWEASNQTFKGAELRERFDFTTAEPTAIGVDAQPVAFRNKFGRGEAMVIGTLVGLENYRAPQVNHPLVPELVPWAGLTIPSVKSDAFVELRRMTFDGGSLSMLFNHGEKAAHVEVPEVFSGAAKRYRELITGAAVSAPKNESSWTVEIPAESVRVLRIDR